MSSGPSKYVLTGDRRGPKKSGAAEVLQLRAEIRALDPSLLTGRDRRAWALARVIIDEIGEWSKLNQGDEALELCDELQSSARALLNYLQRQHDGRIERIAAVL